MPTSTEAIRTRITFCIIHHQYTTQSACYARSRCERYTATTWFISIWSRSVTKCRLLYGDCTTTWELPSYRYSPQLSAGMQLGMLVLVLVFDLRIDFKSLSLKA